MDAHVGKHLFEECILRELAGRTRIIVLHQMQYIHNADYIIILEGGRVKRFGSPAQLEASGEDFSAYFTQDQASNASETDGAKDGGAATAEKEEAVSEEKDQTKRDEPKEAKEANSGKLTAAEDREVGIVRMKVYSAYLTCVRRSQSRDLQKPSH